MLADLLINLFYSLASFIIGLIGTVINGVANLTLGQFPNEVDTVISYAISLDNILPIATILAIIVIEVQIEIAIFTYKAIRWAYQKIPGVS